MHSVGRTRVTHCPQGHEYTPGNVYWMNKRPGGPKYQKCKACSQKKDKKKYIKQEGGKARPIELVRELLKEMLEQIRIERLNRI